MIYCKYMKLKILCQIFLRRISQSEIRNPAAEKSESESEGGQKFLPPNPLPYLPARASGFVPAARSAAIRRSFVQNRFELRSVIATNSDILKIQRRFVARRKPCPPALFQLRRVNISELNQRVGQIQIQFFGKANGGSELRSNSSRKCGISNFFLSASGGIQSKFFNPALLAKPTNN